MKQLICMNRRPVPASSRYFFFAEDGSIACYAATTNPPDDKEAKELDNRRSAFLFHDKMTIPVGGGSRICIGPGDMLAGTQACLRSGVRILVDTLAIDAMEATYLARTYRETA